MKSKLFAILLNYLNARRDAALRRELAAFNDSPDDQSESAAWRRVMEASQWAEPA